jgi:hypothetical protein
MKKLMLFLCIMLFSSFVIASPANIGDVDFGYSAISITSSDGLIGDESSNIVDVGKVTDNNIMKNINIKSMLMSYSGQAKTGAGVLNTVGLVSYQNLNCSNRHLQHEVGWRTSI